MKSLKRLGIDPLAVYGTLCVKCPVADPSLARPGVHRALLEELAIVAAEDRRGDGRGRARRRSTTSTCRWRGPIDPSWASIQRLHAVDARRSYVPNIDDALDEEAAKRAFWSAFRVLGEWYEDLPPY